MPINQTCSLAPSGSLLGVPTLVPACYARVAAGLNEPYEQLRRPRDTNQLGVQNDFRREDSTHLFVQGKILRRLGSAYCNSERSGNDVYGSSPVSPELRLVIMIELPYLERQHRGHVRAIKL